MCCSPAWRTHFTHMQTLTIVATSMQSQQIGGMWMCAQNLRFQSLMMKMTSRGPFSNPDAESASFRLQSVRKQDCNRLPKCGMTPYVASIYQITRSFLWSHKGLFLLLLSHMQKHSSIKNTLKRVRLVELSLKCADISCQIGDTSLQFGFTNLKS